MEIWHVFLLRATSRWWQTGKPGVPTRTVPSPPSVRNTQDIEWTLVWYRHIYCTLNVLLNMQLQVHVVMCSVWCSLPSNSCHVLDSNQPGQRLSDKLQLMLQQCSHSSPWGTPGTTRHMHALTMETMVWTRLHELLGVTCEAPGEIYLQTEVVSISTTGWTSLQQRWTKQANSYIIIQNWSFLFGCFTQCTICIIKLLLLILTSAPVMWETLNRVKYDCFISWFKANSIPTATLKTPLTNCRDWQGNRD